MQEPPTSTAAQDVWLRVVAAELAGESVDFELLCAERPELSDELHALRTHWLMPRAPSPDASRVREAESVDELLLRLAAPSTRRARYRFQGELARGGMGVVHRVWDADLGRTLALKLLRTQSTGSDRRILKRFVAEARVVARLDHPAIVPVHDIGVDEFGRPFFVMKLVEGCDLREIFALTRQGAHGWSTTRALGALLTVAEAVGYAHRRGVVHRDLKPSNVMVGLSGEVYVMDWGVARVLAALDADGDDAGQVSEPRALTRTSTRADADSSVELLTADGEVVGTAAYMSPEQARGDSSQITARSDVYAFGAMLYHLLAQRLPYSGDGLTSERLVELVRAGPPQSLAEFAPRVAQELAAICDKAMARAPEQRYGDLSECAADLRAFLEGRVVRAHRVGPWIETSKWIRRNRALSAAFVIAVTLGAGVLWTTQHAAHARENLALLSRLRQPTELLAEYELLWPASPSKLSDLRRWLADAEGVVRQRDEYRAQLVELRERTQPWDPCAAPERVAELRLSERRVRGRRLIELLEEQRASLLETGATETFDGMTLAEIEAQLAHDRPIVQERFARPAERATWTFAEAHDQMLHDRLTALVPDVERLEVDARGYSRIERVRRAIDSVLVQEAEPADARRDAWDDAIASIRDSNECPHYGGLVLAPQEGLLPIGRDPQSGLWEFAHTLSGEVARRGAGGRLVMEDETGIVLVLLPGGEYWQGSQDVDPDAPGFDPWRQLDEGPMTAVILDPFFLSKYELTQAQWRRWNGRDPSYATFETSPNSWVSATQPVEGIQWKAGAETLHEFGLSYPSEAQWEYAARAGTQTPWSDARGVAGLAQCANLYDSTCWRLALRHSLHPERLAASDPLLGDDGFEGAAPVGSFAPNAFGLHDMHGNVYEWTGDFGSVAYVTPRWVGTGLRATQGVDEGGRIVRGGGYYSTPRAARCAARAYRGREASSSDLGLRPARTIVR